MQSILAEMHRVHLQRTENLCKFDFPPRTIPYLASWWDGNFRIGCWVLEINYFKSPGVRKSTDIKRSCDLISKTALPSCTGIHSFFAPLTRYCSWTSFQVCWSPSPAVIFFWALSRRASILSDFTSIDTNSAHDTQHSSSVSWKKRTSAIKTCHKASKPRHLSQQCFSSKTGSFSTQSKWVE